MIIIKIEGSGRNSFTVILVYGSLSLMQKLSDEQKEGHCSPVFPGIFTPKQAKLIILTTYFLNLISRKSTSTAYTIRFLLFS